MAEPLPRPADPGTVDADNPWPGLAAFREADRELFYGRETETQEILRLALRERLTVLFGLSGLGKTSLLRAGLFPRLREQNVLPVYIRLDFSAGEGARRTLADQVRQAIAREAEAAGVEAPPLPESETLWESLHRQGAEFWSPRNRIVTPLLVFDQFEEVFTLGRGNAARIQETEAFLAELADLSEGSAPASVRERLQANPERARDFSFNRHPYKILLSLREDFLPELEGLRGRIRSIVHNRFRLRRMNGDNALRVITEAGGHLVEPDVPERVVRFVAARESDEGTPLAGLEIEPALLSVVCRELNNKRRAGGLPRITAGLVRGNRKEILSDLYERSVEDLGPEVRSFVEERLLTRSGFRDTVALENALELPGVTREALDRLTDRRLLRIEDRGGMQRLELTHDVLTEVICKSRDSRREREARERGEAARRQAEEREREARRKLRRSRILMAVFVVLFLAAVTAAWWGYRREKDARATLAGSDLREAVRLTAADQEQEALAYLARAVRSDPDNAAARRLLLHLLLYRGWHLPRTVIRHELPVWGAELSPDGRFLLTRSFASWSLGVDKAETSRRGIAQVWNAETGHPVGRPMEHTGEIWVAHFSPDGRFVVTGSQDRTARVWDAATGRPVTAPLLHKSYVSDARFSPDGRLVSTISEKQAQKWNARTGAPAGSLLAHPGETGYSFSPGGRLFAASTDRGELVIRDVETGLRVGAPIPTEQRAIAVQFSAQGQILLARSTSKTRTVQLWDVRTGRPGPALEHEDYAHSAEVSPDRRLLVTASGEMARFWDPVTGRPAGEPLAHPAVVLEARFSPDGRFVLTRSEDNAVRLWDVATRLPAGEPMRHEGRVISAIFSRGGKLVATASMDGTARLWQVHTGQARPQTFAGLEAADVALSPDGDRFAIVTTDYEVHIQDARTGRPLGPPFEVPELDSFFFTRDGVRLITLSGKRVRAWDVQTGKPLGDAVPLGEKSAFRVTADGQRAITIGPDGVVRTLDVSTGRALSEPRRIEAAAETTIDPTGRRAVTVTPRGARLWDLATGRSISDLPRSEQLFDAPFSGDGGRLITISNSRVHVRDAATGQIVGRAVEHLGTVQVAELSPDRLRLLLASLPSSDYVRTAGGRSVPNSTARIWNLETGEPAGEPLSHETLLAMARFSGDGQSVVTSTWGGTLRLWDARTGFLLAGPLRSGLFPGAVGFGLTPDGQRVLAKPGDSAGQIWDLPCGSPQDAALLADLAEAVGGAVVGELEAVRSLQERQTGLLERLRRDSAGAPRGRTTALSLIRWLLDDPWERTVSPLSPELVREHLESVVAHDDWDHRALREARTALPGHPLLYRNGPSRPP